MMAGHFHSSYNQIKSKQQQKTNLQIKLAVKGNAPCLCFRRITQNSPGGFMLLVVELMISMMLGKVALTVCSHGARFHSGRQS